MDPCLGTPRVFTTDHAGRSQVSEAAEHVERRTTSNWRRPRCPIPDENIERESRITQLAFTLLGGRDSALPFLNSFDSALGASPLHLAGASADGYSAVHALLLRRVPISQSEPT